MSAGVDFLKAHRLEVYASIGCPDCVRLDRWMAQHEIAHKKVLIDHVDGAAEKLENETGKQGVPYILVDGRTWVRGYHLEERTRFSEEKLLSELQRAIA